MSNFPTFNGREDTAKFGFDVEDVGIRSTMEGGYVLTRPRHTRKPRRTWMTGFTDLSNDEMNTFLAFWDDVGTFKGFTYYVIPNNELVNVRFASKPSFAYKGQGGNYRWDINDIKLEEI
jgi:hypothetical protein